LNGISIAKDSTRTSTISLFKNVHPVENKAQSILPMDFDAITSYTFNNFTTFLKNKNPDPLKKVDSLFYDIDEFAIINNAEKKAIIIHAKNFEILNDSLENISTEDSTFREYLIYKIKRTSIIETNFKPLIQNFSAEYYSVVNEFFVF